MAHYRGPSGDVEAVQFKSRAQDDVLCILDPGSDAEGRSLPTWVIDALNDKRLELAAFGRGLVVTHDAGSYGIAPGDWIILLHGGRLSARTDAKFAAEYEPVHG